MREIEQRVRVHWKDSRCERWKVGDLFSAEEKFVTCSACRAGALSRRPKKIVICGSSRFIEVMAVVAWILEREEGAITLGLHLLPQWYRSPDGNLPEDHLAEHEGCEAKMDELHMRKIDLAHEIYVVDVDEYVGESTKKEMSYAARRGKGIRKLSEELPMRRKIAEMLVNSVSEMLPKIKAARKKFPWEEKD